ncbi:hypothetical protein [Methylobacterium radiotolerans]|uniref:Uncharacterized protein n=1 Tax=Methylobacterium radiotolerans (strain ATCC 27329 / DSM 1819 / JCM 2831 / NBRC 15690 / NCIMB 10815 / 0-1) TaxID=426355 RepID=B1MAD1_METRJ|nr:hypothetical protein [Methylobacterium radiotolerans]ACB28456.1 hypothetical protein Mrad2831_6544 [Methylobacterium radiotolerans JCM 2831]GEN01711.1 hypothetical protein MRA01_62500 [Methylobacterium radiotolerans]
MADDKPATGDGMKEQIDQLARHIEQARLVARNFPPSDGMHHTIRRKEAELAEMRRQYALREQREQQASGDEA